MADVEEFSMDDLLYASQSGTGDRKEEEEEDESSSFGIMAGDRYSGAEGEEQELAHVWLPASETNSILFIGSLFTIQGMIRESMVLRRATRLIWDCKPLQRQMRSKQLHTCRPLDSIQKLSHMLHWIAARLT